jgi:hypothetical protein
VTNEETIRALSDMTTRAAYLARIESVAAGVISAMAAEGLTISQGLSVAATVMARLTEGLNEETRAQIVSQLAAKLL